MLDRHKTKKNILLKQILKEYQIFHSIQINNAFQHRTFGAGNQDLPVLPKSQVSWNLWYVMLSSPNL